MAAPRFNPEDRPSILVVRRRYFGDIILVTRMLRNLRLAFPQSWIAVAVDDAFAEVLETNPDINEILVIPNKKLKGLAPVAMAWLKLIRQLIARRYDLAFDLAQNNRSRLCLKLGRARERVTFDLEEHPLKRRSFYTEVEPVGIELYNRQHITEMNDSLLRRVGVTTPFSGLVMPLKEEAIASVQTWLDATVSGWRERPLLALHPGTRTAPRIWPVERYTAAVRHAVEKHRASVLLIGGPAEQAFLQTLRDQLGTATTTHLVPVLPFHELVAMIAEADAMLCHDSGPMHIAAAVGTPVVALFGKQSVRTWGPLGEHHHCLQGPMPCACLLPDKCDQRDPYFSYCVRHISVAQVCDSLDKLLENPAAIP